MQNSLWTNLLIKGHIYAFNPGLKCHFIRTLSVLTAQDLHFRVTHCGYMVTLDLILLRAQVDIAQEQWLD